MMLDAATAGLMAQSTELGMKHAYEMGVAQARLLTAGMREICGPGPEVERATNVTIPAADGSKISIRLLVPANPRMVTVYLHGGGWVAGKPEDFEAVARELAVRSKSAVVAVGYRLAPEFPYPTPLDDAWDALCWASEHRADLAGEGAPLVIAGDSAGGNLAAAVAQRSVQNAGPKLDLQVLIYPVVGADFETASYLDAENQLMVDRDDLIWFWDQYVPGREHRDEPGAAPIKADDLSGLPPALILTAEHDVLRDEGEAYAERLRTSGVEVEAKRFMGQAHGFFHMVNILPGSEEGLTYVADRLRRLKPEARAAH